MIGLTQYLMFCSAMLRREPIVTWTTLYHAFVYGLLFLLLEVGQQSNDFLFTSSQLIL